MIKTFRSKALELFWTRNDARRLPVAQHARVHRLLKALDAASVPQDMNLPGFHFHALATTPISYSVRVTGNYRIVWEWNSGAENVDILDYH